MRAQSLMESVKYVKRSIRQFPLQTEANEKHEN